MWAARIGGGRNFPAHRLEWDAGAASRFATQGQERAGRMSEIDELQRRIAVALDRIAAAADAATVAAQAAAAAEHRAAAAEARVAQLVAVNAELRRANAGLRRLNAAHLGDPAAIDEGLRAELDALRAVREAEVGELDAILSALAPLVGTEEPRHA